MSTTAKKSRKRPERVGKNERPQSVPLPGPGDPAPTPRGIPNDVELAQLISDLIYGVRDGRITPNIANAAFTGVSRLLKLAELANKYGGDGRVLAFASGNKSTKPAKPVDNEAA